MALQLFGFHERPHDFAVTKAGTPLEECVFLLDFERPLKRQRWLFGLVNKWVGLTVGLIVPVVHQSEEAGGYVIGVRAGQPYFVDMPKLWKQHAGLRRTLRAPPVDGFTLIADFATHFPEDC